MDAEQLVQMSPSVLLATVLFFIGQGLKASPVANWLVPWILMGLGAATYPFITEVVDGLQVIDGRTVASPFIYNLVIGVGIGALPTWGYEAMTQFSNRKDKTGDTKFLKR